jgi:aromatic ring-opening dioxygenase catalytic subunit (LigB family)
MPIVFACAASHAPGMTAWTEAAPKEQSEKFLGCYRKLGEMLAASRPDVLVAITVEHWANFFLNHMPAFCIGRADHYEGPVEEWLRIPKARVPGDSKLSAELLAACLDGGFDPTFSDELLFDHATMLPLHFLNPNMAVPVIPVIINTLTTPMRRRNDASPLGSFCEKTWRDAKKESPSLRPAACPIGRAKPSMERSTFLSTESFSTP